ncbi:BC85_0335 family putative methyltransferase [Mycoplasma struthionis]|uniref:Class I SAM-dependent methyltransferase n=1 Tax=Mycoplasma struthionis TaxID=538220 RepID=A0A3G8LGR8_9MOLU|nr:hypothetical protein [Mycoplasma struthionis]AZG68883.1 hypothetical protein EGN60_02940 [Mycoplasma struthionis]
MKNNFIKFNGEESKIPDHVRLILGITIGIALLIAIIVFVATVLYKKKIQNSEIVNNQHEKELIAKLKTENENYGVILNGIKKYYEFCLDDLTVTFLANSIYLNNFENVNVVSRNDYLAISLSNLTKAKIYQEKNYLEIQKISEIKNDFPDINTSELFYSDNNIEYDAVFDLRSSHLETQINDGVKKLKKQGLIIIYLNSIKEYKQNLSLINSLVDFKHEIFKIKHQKLLLLSNKH